MRRAGAALCAALCSAAPAIAAATCVAVVARPEGTPLATIAGAHELRIAYVHSVTRTPVEERYRVDADAFTQTQIRFVEHGPGLPTQADAGQAFLRVGSGFVVTMQRRLDAIPMRVHADQSPTLAVADDTLDLARWGNRPLAIVRVPACPAP